MTELADLTDVAKKALLFKNEYYKALDSAEMRLAVTKLYYEGIPNIMEWNGHVLSSQAEISQYLAQLPKTVHTIDSMDAQPLPGNEKSDSFLMTVHGTVVYDDEHSREFFQRMVLRLMDGKYYIFNDYYRWLSEKSN